jgi:hypothetical protein
MSIAGQYHAVCYPSNRVLTQIFTIQRLQNISWLGSLCASFRPRSQTQEITMM